ncbi:ROK family protein [Clostridium polynesiense]|uniref:ROK family protein n=1 Tax=Clostridium polynesiense TaxID=1325933 RepID=UPI00058F6DC1|nr:ROK family protein [Clostridium polynesiense]
MLLGAVEAGGTKFVCAVGNENGEVLERIRIDTTTPEETLSKVFEFFKEREVEAIGLGFFGPLDLNEKSETYGYITTTPKEAWRNYDVLGAFKDNFQLPVVLDTDVNAACMGEAVWGAAKGLKNCLYLTIGTGVGGGAMVDGNLVHGMLHPEMGHILLRRHSDDDFQGICPWHKDCLEGMVSGPALIKRIKGKDVMELKEEDEVWEFYAYYLAQALVNYILILSPEKIILGGGVMKQEHLLKKIQFKVKELLADYVAHDNVKDGIEGYIVLPGLGDNAGISGGLALAKKALLNK